jgi:hypothetical protein
VQGMLDSSGIPEQALKFFIEAYTAALEKHLGEESALLVSPLRRFSENGSG